MTPRAAAVAAVLGGPLLSASKVFALASVADLGLLGPLALGLVLAAAQAAWIATRHFRDGTVWALASAAALIYLVMIIGVLGTLYSNADGFR